MDVVEPSLQNPNAATDNGSEDQKKHMLPIASLESLLLQCKDGVAEACRALSNRYATGEGVKKDEGKVLSFAQQARRLQNTEPKTKPPTHKRNVLQVYDYSQAIREIGPLQFEAGKRDLQVAFSDLGHLQSGARILPNMPSPAFLAGFRLRNVQENSFFAAIGLRHDDIIRAVNDKEIDDTRKISLLFRAFVEEDDVRLTVNRGGQLQTHHIRIVERPISLVQQETIDPDAAPRGTSFGHSRLGFSRWVVSRSNNHFEVTVPLSARKTVMELPINEHGWLIEVRDGTGMSGIRLAGILRGGIFDGLGLQPGDIIRGLNGARLSSKSDLDPFPARLLEVGPLQITISRNAASLSLSYDVRSYAPSARDTIHHYGLSAPRIQDVLPELADDTFRPSFRDGLLVGMRIIKPGAWLSDVFLQAADVLVSMNDKPIENAEQARAALKRLTQPGVVQLDIERRDTKLKIEYDIQPVESEK